MYRSPSLDTGALASLASLSAPPGWASARDALVPLLLRRGSYALIRDPVSVQLEPGVRVSFAVDLGPMFLHVSGSLLRTWPVDVAQVARQALLNLRVRSQPLAAGSAVRTRVGLTSLSVLQAPGGWASSLVLVPDLLPRWFGSGPRIFIAPARNLLVAVPAKTDHRLAHWLRDEIAAQMADALDVPPLSWDGFRLRPLRGLGRSGTPRPPTGL